MSKAVKIKIEFVEFQDKEGVVSAEVEINSATGGAVSFNGDLYPVELRLTNDIVQLLKTYKDSWGWINTSPKCDLEIGPPPTPGRKKE